MLKLPSHLNPIIHTGRQADFGSLARSIRNQCVRRHTSVGLRRDLSVCLPIPRAQIELSVYETSKGAVESLVSQTQALSAHERREVALRLKCAREDVGRCYIAFTNPGGKACFVQWVFDTHDNPWVQSFFRRRFPLLKEGEVLFENAYTPPPFRGLGVMSSAMATIAAQEAALGAQYGLTFVAHDNIASLKGCAKAGFHPYTSRHDASYFFGLFRKRRFVPLPQSEAGGVHAHHRAN